MRCATAGDGAGAGRAGDRPARPVWRTAVRVSSVDSGPNPRGRPSGGRGVCCRGDRRTASGDSRLDQGFVRGGRLSLSCRVEPPPAGRSLGARRAACRDAAAPARRHHRQDAHGRVRLWRHRSQQPSRRSAQSVGCRGAPLAERFVERGRGQPARRLGAARVWQRHCRLGAHPGLHDRNGRPQGDARPIAQ